MLPLNLQGFLGELLTKRRGARGNHPVSTSGRKLKWGFAGDLPGGSNIVDEYFS